MKNSFKKEDFEGFANPKYGIGELSSMLKLHPQTIRFFEEQKILTPQRTESGIRKYSVYDAYMLQLRKNYENLGFSLDDTKKILSYENTEDVLDSFEDARKRLKEEVELEKFLIKGIKELCYTIDNINLFYGNPSYKIRPAHYRHTHLDGEDLCSDADSCKARLKAIELMPYAKYSIRLPATDVNLKEPSYYHCDVAVPEDAALRYGFDKIPNTWYVPEKLYLYSIIKLPSLCVPQIKDCDFMKDFMKQKHLKLNGNIYCDILINITEDGQKYQYFETWIPVNKKVK